MFDQAEFYGPVRLRGNQHLADDLSKGIKYLEFRGLDTTPFHVNGISRHALYFMKLFFIYALVTPIDSTELVDQLKQSELDNEQVALERPTEPTFKVAEGQRIFKSLHQLAMTLNAHSEQINALDDFAEVMSHPELTPSAKLMSHLTDDGSLMSFGIRRAAEWKARRIGADQLLPRMSRLSVRAQELVFRAVQLGVRYYAVRDEHGEIMLMLTFNELTQVIEADRLADEPATAYLKRLFPDLPLPKQLGDQAI